MKKTIGIIFGGYSGEAIISQRSAVNVIELVDTDKYNKYLIELDKNREWWLHHDGTKFPRINSGSLDFRINDQVITIDCAINMIHGRPGETGELQGHFDTIEIPYTGSVMSTMVKTFDKHTCNTLLRDNYLPVAKNYLHSGEVTKECMTNIAEQLGPGPYFVKPNSGGSSLGSGIAHTGPDLFRLLNEALEHDDHAIIEEYVTGREFSIGVVEFDGKVISLPVTELVSGNDFFDFDAKYNGDSKEITPADIPTELSQKLQDIGQEIFRLFNCSDMIRFEVIVDQDSKMYILDVNTIPGFTSESILPQQIAAADIDVKKFVSEMINRAIER